MVNKQKKEEDFIINSFKWLGVCVAGLVGLSIALTECHEDKSVAPAQMQRLTIKQQGFAEFFKRHGSPAPEQMAVAVSSTKNPALMAAMAVKESNGDPKAVGDSGNSKGAFQVQERHWGKVSSDPVEQALQAERILEELLSSARHLRRGNPRLRVALAQYNGGTIPPRVSYRYADHVIKIERSMK
jgi:hypothetical protein